MNPRTKKSHAESAEKTWEKKGAESQSVVRILLNLKDSSWSSPTRILIRLINTLMCLLAMGAAICNMRNHNKTILLVAVSVLVIATFICCIDLLWDDKKCRGKGTEKKKGDRP
jgi:hypothetical protein